MGRGALGFLVLWLLIRSALVGASASLSLPAMDSYQKHVDEECAFTRYPSPCVEILVGLDSGNQPIDFVSTLLGHAISEAKLTHSDFAKFSSQFGAEDAKTADSVAGYCQELTKMSLGRLDQSLLALKQSPKKNKRDIQTWLSAALTFQQACKDTADSLSVSEEFIVQLSKKMDYLSQLVSNPLALVNRITGKSRNNKTRPLGQDQATFPKWVYARDRKLLQATTIKANAVVAKDGSGNYETISKAIEAASGKRFVIYVKSGVYREKIRTNKDGITLIGDGRYSTLVVGDDSVAKHTSLPATATFTITGDGFIARDIGFQNTAGPQGQQAVALSIASDHSVLFRCTISGYQDSLYALALRQFYRECDIYGTVDFIFGNAAAVFQSCNLILRRPHSGYNVILANGRNDPGQDTGFSIHKCNIRASSDFYPVKHSYNSYLGRPWKQYSRSVIMESTIDDCIASRGWIEWPGASSSSLRTLYFAEYSNVGPGARLSKRVQWPGFHAIGAEKAVEFTVANFIHGTSWLPPTGVTFISGL
ncbi:probable pectinesterase/pectinesterase inhibitor 54 isoform X1 [Juglans microcarpa x Juglans regia]|uniref:probable pectinesterase/pectinesterase inhibitor 54 isoform X1 n=1 Tax=Juglans microcarpa x Juglans regia TaxID=2249226 RepID=UPI001B7EE6EA|nr:probable pectinesterase/pectinesterase inhibitor 54 isoform X1 [Juglans microcarpa x Juglans regia]